MPDMRKKQLEGMVTNLEAENWGLRQEIRRKDRRYQQVATRNDVLEAKIAEAAAEAKKFGAFEVKYTYREPGNVDAKRTVTVNFLDLKAANHHIGAEMAISDEEGQRRPSWEMFGVRRVPVNEDGAPVVRMQLWDSVFGGQTLPGFNV